MDQVNSLPNDKILEWSKLKAFADNKIKVLKMMIFLYLIRLKTLWEKEKMLVISIFSFSYNVFESCLFQRLGSFSSYIFNPLPDMQILGSSNSVANKDIMSKIWTNGDTLISLSRKHCVKRRNCSLRAISSFPTMFSKTVYCWCVKMNIYGVKRLRVDDISHSSECLTISPIHHCETVPNSKKLQQFQLFPQRFPKAFFFSVLR